MTEESNIQFGNEFNRRAESQGVLVSRACDDDDVAVAVLSRAQGIVQAPKRNKVDRIEFREWGSPYKKGAKYSYLI